MQHARDRTAARGQTIQVHPRRQIREAHAERMSARLTHAAVASGFLGRDGARLSARSFFFLLLASSRAWATSGAAFIKRIRRAMVRQYGAVAGNWATNVMLARDKDAIRQTTLEEDLEELFNFLKTRRGARRASEAYA